MVHSDLKSTDLCGYDNSASSMHWVLDPVQTRTQFNVGGPGVPTGVGLNTPGEVISVDSFLKNVGNYISSCVPPPVENKDSEYSGSQNMTFPPVQGVETGDDVQYLPNSVYNNNEVLDYKENFGNVNSTNGNYKGLISAHGSYANTVVDSTTFLLPDAGQTVKRSANDTSSVDWHAGFGGNANNLHTHPQNLTHVIERMSLERGGLDSNQLLKQSYNLYNKQHPQGPTNFNGVAQKPTATKVRTPYPISAPFGLEFNQKSEHYDAIDVASVGISSPMLDQNNKIPYNYEAKYSNGGCNQISLIKNEKMCSDNTNDLTGIDSYSWTKGIYPAGI